MQTFFTGDTHFGDHRVLNIRRRPFRSVADMNDTMIRLWNSRVRPSDEIWHLGDFASNAKTAEYILPRLHGRKHLVLGNLDGPHISALGWSSWTASWLCSVTTRFVPGTGYIADQLTCMATAMDD
jgi:calcineurin-like phosphoesterase family protein